MVFGKYMQQPAEQDPQSDQQREESIAKWLKDEPGWEDCQERSVPTDEDAEFLDVATATSTSEPNEVDKEADWDWDLLGAVPSNEAAGAQVIDDYLLVDGPAPRSLGLYEDAVSDTEEATGRSATPDDDPLPACGTAASEEADSEVSTQEALSEPHSADDGAGPIAETAVAGLTAPSPEKEEVSSREVSGQKEKQLYECRFCNNPIFKDEDILSPNYHAMTGPGYLTSVATNVSIALEMQTQLYTTGKYTVQEVSCGRCSATLGVTYAGAADARNRYKVGKFLLGRDRLMLPPGVVHPMDEDAK